MKELNNKNFNRVRSAIKNALPVFEHIYTLSQAQTTLLNSIPGTFNANDRIAPEEAEILKAIDSLKKFLKDTQYNKQLTIHLNFYFQVLKITSRVQSPLNAHEVIFKNTPSTWRKNHMDSLVGVLSNFFMSNTITYIDPKSEQTLQNLSIVMEEAGLNLTAEALQKLSNIQQSSQKSQSAPKPATAKLPLKESAYSETTFQSSLPFQTTAAAASTHDPDSSYQTPLLHNH